MKVEIGETYPVLIENEGTLMDYVDKEFVFIIKDTEWTEYEKAALQRNRVQIDFIYLYDIAVFLFTLDDAIDTSDFIFQVHDGVYGEDLYRSFEKGSGFTCSIYLLDKMNRVSGVRKVQLSYDMSNCIVMKLKEQKEHVFVEAEFICNLEGLQNAYEPFELQPKALMSDSFK